MPKFKIRSNEVTLRAYNADIASYLKHTPANYDDSHHLLLRWIDASIELSDKNKPILEIGSGAGRDALYIQSKGYTITCSDAAQAFVNHLRNLPLKTIELDLLKDPLPAGYHMIFANAVFPHFTFQETVDAIRKIYDALPVGGIFAFNVKQGVGSLWTREKLRQKRYMFFWHPDAIEKVVTDMGFKILYKNTNIAGDLRSHTWTHLTLQK